MTDEQLAEIEARAAAATAGPWTLIYDGDVNDVDFATFEYRWPWQILDANGEVVVDMTGGGDVIDANAEFLGSARTDVPALVAEVRRLRDVVEVAVGAMMLIRSADRLAEKDRLAFQAMNEILNMAGWGERVNPERARTVLAPTKEPS